MAMNQAKKRYTRGVLAIMSIYVGLVLSSTSYVHHWHPAGWHLYLAAVLPTIPILGLTVIVGRYLRDEKDEYQRDMTIRCLLWGTAVALALSVFSGFMHSYSATFEVPQFAEFIAFWITVGLARAIQTIANRGGSDE